MKIGGFIAPPEGGVKAETGSGPCVEAVGDLFQIAA